MVRASLNRSARVAKSSIYYFEYIILSYLPDKAGSDTSSS